MKNIILYIFLFTCFYSCKKEELNGDLAYLEGKWKFYASINYASHTTTYTNSMAFDEENMHYLKFESNGQIKLYNSENKLVERGRIVSYTSRPSNIYPNGIYYEVEIGSNSIFNRKLNKITSFILISTNQSPMEIITNDIIYESPVLELVFQKM